MKKLLYLILFSHLFVFADNFCITHNYLDVGHLLRVCYIEKFDNRLYNNLVDSSTVFIETQEELHNSFLIRGYSSKDYWSVCAIGKYHNKVNQKIRIKLYRSNGTLRFNGNTWTTGCKVQPKGKIDLSTVILYEGYCITRNGNEGKFVNDPSKCK